MDVLKIRKAKKSFPGMVPDMIVKLKHSNVVLKYMELNIEV